MPHFGTLICRKCKKVRLMLFFCQFSNSCSSKTTGLNSSVQISNKILCQMVFLLNWSHLLFVRSVFCLFLRPFDGKYPSETAPLVSNCLLLFQLSQWSFWTLNRIKCNSIKSYAFRTPLKPDYREKWEILGTPCWTYIRLFSHSERAHLNLADFSSNLAPHADNLE